MNLPNHPFHYYQVEADRWIEKDGEIIGEAPVSLTVNGEAWLSFMCTPLDLEALAVGFLFNEGLIQTIDEVSLVQVCGNCDNIDIWLNHNVKKPTTWRRTSGCTGGITSVDNSAELGTPPAMLYDGAPLTPRQVTYLVEELFESQDLYRKSGGVHTSALSDGQRMVVVAEDIGRHNSLDKIAGRCLIEHIDIPRRILLTTGRISSEMMQKSARLGAAVVISRTSPSSLSIQMALRWGITLIGYARRTGFRLYTHTERIFEDLPQNEA